MTTLVLVHGAFRGAWSWAPTCDALAARGVDAVALDLVGAGARWRADQSPIGLDETAADLADTVVDLAADVVLVGHSQGSLVIRAALGRRLHNVVAVAHLDGAVPETGECAVDLLDAPPPPRDLLVQPPPPDAALPLPLRDLVARSTRPQHAAIAADPVPAIVTDVPTHWAFCSQTPAGFPSDRVRRRLVARGVAHAVLDAPHDAPLAAPEIVATWLARVAGQCHTAAATA